MPQDIFDRLHAESRGGAIPPPPKTSASNDIFDQLLADESSNKKTDAPVAPETWSSGASRIIRSAGSEFGIKIDPEHPYLSPITSAIESTSKGLYDTITKILSPDNPLGVAGNVLSGVYNEAKDIKNQYESAFTDNDPQKLQEAYGRSLGIIATLWGGGKGAKKVAPLLEGVPEAVTSRLEYRQPKGVRQPVLFDEPVQRIRTGLGIKGMENADIVKAVNELKDAEIQHGPITHVDQAVEATRSRVDLYNQENAKLLQPYNKLPVRGSRRAMVDAEIAAIPDTLRVGDPAKYNSTVNNIRTKLRLPDLTVKELNDMRVSANKQFREFYSKNPLGQMTAEQQLHTATLEAQGSAARGLIYDRLPSNISEAFAENNSRIGAMTKLEQNLYRTQDAARLQSATPSLSFGRIKNAITSKGASELTHGGSSTINSDLANAMRRWKGSNAPVILGPAPELHPMNPITTPGRLLREGFPLAPPTEPPSGGASFSVSHGLPFDPNYIGRHRQLPSGLPLPPPTELPSGGFSLSAPHGQPVVPDPNLIAPRAPSSLHTPTGSNPPLNAPELLYPHPSVAPEAVISGSPRPFGKLRFSHNEYRGGKPTPVYVDEAGRTFRY